jgi:multimeric flavodoxin WrbA
MKILAICGSPHKGNSYNVLSYIKETYLDIDFKMIMLSELNLEQCKGCYQCVLKGEDKCPLNDDRDTLLDEMMKADGVLFATPVHVNHVSALMKQFIDRIGFIAHRPRFFGKYAMVMSVCAGFGADKANDYMKGILSVFGFQVVAALELKIAVKTETESNYNQELTIKAFDRFLAGIRKGQQIGIQPSLTQLIYFNVFKAISEKTRLTNVADYEFYKDKRDYVSDVKINPIKNMLAKRIAKGEVKKVMMNR